MNDNKESTFQTRKRDQNRRPIQPGRFQQQQPQYEEAPMFVSAKEKLWVWELRWVWTGDGEGDHVAFNRETKEERKLGIGKEKCDRAAAHVQALNMSLTEKK